MFFSGIIILFLIAIWVMAITLLPLDPKSIEVLIPVIGIPCVLLIWWIIARLRKKKMSVQHKKVTEKERAKALQDISSYHINRSEKRPSDGYYFENIFEFVAYCSLHKGENVKWLKGDSYIKRQSAGYDLECRHMYSKALELYRESLEFNPVGIKSRLGICEVYIQRKESDQAKSVLLETIDYLIDDSSIAMFYQTMGNLFFRAFQDDSLYKCACACYLYSLKFEHSDYYASHVRNIANNYNIVVDERQISTIFSKHNIPLLKSYSANNGILSKTGDDVSPLNNAADSSDNLFSSDSKSVFQSVYSETYHSILPIVEASSIAKNGAFELLPAMYIIADFSLSHKKEEARVTFSKSIMQKLTDEKNLDESQIAVFQSRIDLYGKVIRGEYTPRGDWCLADPQSLADTPVGLICVILGDILVNPACADDYANAPVTLYGMDELFDFFQSVMNPVFHKLLEFYKHFSQ